MQAIFHQRGAQGGKALAAGLALTRADDAEHAFGPQGAIDRLGVAGVVWRVERAT
jgi:hypothetical protein